MPINPGQVKIERRSIRLKSTILIHNTQIMLEQLIERLVQILRDAARGAEPAPAPVPVKAGTNRRSGRKGR